MHVEISMAKHGSAGGPFAGHVRGLVAMHGKRGLFLAIGPQERASAWQAGKLN